MGTCCVDRELSSALCDALEEWDGEVPGEVQERGHMCTHIADSLHRAAETNTDIVKQLYANFL